jgi:hypothetical protein
MTPAPVAMLLDVDNTLVDNDRVIADLKRPLTRTTLTAVKKVWGSRVTTVFPRQGHYALDPETLAGYPPADVTLDSIGDLLRFDLPALLQAPQAGRSTVASGSSIGEKP